MSQPRTDPGPTLVAWVTLIALVLITLWCMRLEDRIARLEDHIRHDHTSQIKEPTP
jgi:hypothetical protein